MTVGLAVPLLVTVTALLTTCAAWAVVRSYHFGYAGPAQLVASLLAAVTAVAGLVLYGLSGWVWTAVLVGCCCVLEMFVTWEARRWRLRAVHDLASRRVPVPRRADPGRWRHGQ